MNYLAALYRLNFDYSTGALFWGKEEILQERFPNWHPSPSFAHPLLSGRDKPLRDYMSSIPMFVGTSGDFGPVVVEGLSFSSQKTSFGTMIEPGDIYISDIKEGNYFDDNEWTVWKNKKKPRLSDEEMKSLVKFLDYCRRKCGRK